MRPLLVTAATSPLAVACTRHLVRLGHHVVCLARTPSRATDLPDGVGVCSVDLSDPASIDTLPLPEVAGMLHLAGTLSLSADPVPHGWPDQPQVDRTWATNVLGPARLLQRLLPHLPYDAPVCWVSGALHRRAPLPDATMATTGLRAALHTATAKVLITRALARQHPRLRVTTFCPGPTPSGLARGLPWPLPWLGAAFGAVARDPDAVAREVVPLLLRAQPSGTYLERGTPRAPAPHTDDEALQDAVWARACRWALKEGGSDAPGSEAAPVRP